MSNLSRADGSRFGCVFALAGMALAAAMAIAPVHALTLYICIDAAGKKTYQDSPPSPTECKVEQREVDPDANVISAQDFVGGDAADTARRATRRFSGAVTTPGLGAEPNAAITQEPGVVTTNNTSGGESAGAAQGGAGGAVAGTSPAASGAAPAAPAAAAGGF